MDHHQDSILIGHLTSLIDELERKLAFPKNDWRRKEQLHAELTDAHQGLAILSQPNRKLHRDRSSGQRTQKPQTKASLREAKTTMSSPRARRLEVNYR